jgi:LPXTG-site transpeptidase (sortase) family protein
MKFFSPLLIIISIAFFSFGLYLLWEKNDVNRLSAKTYNYSASETKVIKKNNLPVNVIIPDLSINLQVIPAEMQGTEWQTTKDGVSYLTSSPVPGSTGNSVLYAHNWASLFGKLPAIKPGNVIEIEYANKTKKKFSVAYTLEVSPGDRSILEKSNDKRITLYTCSGLLDNKRFVAVAFLKDN